MKPALKIAIAVAVLLESACQSFAQAAVTVSASASAKIITPIALVKNVDMDFGNVAVSAATAGTEILTPGGTRSTGGAGGVTLPAAAGSVAAASFTVSGQASYTYAITLPASSTIYDGSGHTMTVNSFTSSPAVTGTLGSSGTQVLNIGATLNLSAAQPTGAYTNVSGASGVPVTVNYN